jgi:hypothetical protein
MTGNVNLFRNIFKLIFRIFQDLSISINHPLVGPKIMITISIQSQLNGVDGDR